MKGVIFISKIGKIIKEERIKRKLTLKELSNISNIPISTLSRIENEKTRNVNSAYLYRLCKILNIEYDYLLRQKWEVFPTFFYERKHKIAGK